MHRNRPIPPNRAASLPTRRSSCTRNLVAGLLIAGLLVGLSGLAWAEDTIVLGVSGAGPEGLHDQLSELLVDVVNVNPDLALIEHLEMTVVDALELLAYDEVNPMFLVDLTFSLEADRLLFAVVTEADGVYNTEVTYFDAILGEILLSRSFPFSTEEQRIRTSHELHALVGNQAILELVADRDDVQFSVDDTPLGQTPVVSYGLTPGPHTITATCPECQVATRQITLVAGRFTQENITPGLLSDYVSEPPGGRNMVLPSVTLGTGIAMLGAGIAFGVMTQSTQEDFDASTNYEEAEDLADKGETYATLANVFLFGGGAVAVAGIVLFFVGPGGGEEPQAEQARQTDQENVDRSGWAAGQSGGFAFDWPF
ncbi:MAG: hypothetical protein JW797_10325 [Bradymonadales bacterium]|nr:hypothetical protein [Bradymonadales bacterium]